MTKNNPSESDKVKYIREACKVSDEAVMHAYGNTKPGMTEKDLEKLINDFFTSKGYGQSFPTISVSGENTCDIHGVPSDKAIQKNDIIMIDIGALYQGKEGPWCSDITRTYFVGKPTVRQKEIYNLVKEAQLCSLAAVREGVTGGDVDKAARDYLKSKGYQIPHSVGHGVGRVIHDSPKVGPNSTDVLKAGDVITVEPGIYLQNDGFGVRIEDTVVVTKTGFEYLTKAPKQKAGLESIAELYKNKK